MIQNGVGESRLDPARKVLVPFCYNAYDVFACPNDAGLGTQYVVPGVTTESNLLLASSIMSLCVKGGLLSFLKCQHRSLLASSHTASFAPYLKLIYLIVAQS